MGLLQDITGCTGNRAGLEIQMALDALVVKGIRPFQLLRVLYLIGIVAIQTCFRQPIGFFGAMVAVTTGNKGGFVIHGMVVAIIAGKAVVHIRCMGFMVEQNFSGGNLEHHPHRFLRGFFRERRITQYTH